PTPPPDDGQLGQWEARPRSKPGLRELLPAMAATVVIAAGAWLAGAFPTRTYAHVENAYRLTYVPGGTVTPAQLDIRQAAGTFPRTVDIYRDNQRLRGSLTIPTNAPLTLTLPADGAGSYYQVRSALPPGNLALSNAVWVPPSNLVVVLIDAQ